MQSLRSRVAYMRTALKPSMLKDTGEAVRRRISSRTEALGLRRDLAVEFEPPAAAIDIRVRPFAARDAPVILGLGPGASQDERWDRLSRQRLYDAGFGAGWVAVTEADEPCYVQWLFGAADNDRLHRHFDGSFPVLDPSTALLEGAFTPLPFRGKGIMSAAMAQIAERAADLDARYVLTFVGKENVPSLKGCARAGFSPFLDRVEVLRCFRRRTTFQQMDQANVEVAPVDRRSAE